MKIRVVQKYSQPLSEFRQFANKIRFVQVIGEDIDLDVFVSYSLFHEVKDHLSRMIAEPFILLLKRPGLVINRLFSFWSKWSVFEPVRVGLRRKIAAGKTDFRVSVMEWANLDGNDGCRAFLQPVFVFEIHGRHLVVIPSGFVERGEISPSESLKWRNVCRGEDTLGGRRLSRHLVFEVKPVGQKIRVARWRRAFDGEAR